MRASAIPLLPHTNLIQNFTAADVVDISILSQSSPPRPALQHAMPSPLLSVPSSYNQTLTDNLARFENIISPWSAGRSQRPLSSKSENRTSSNAGDRGGHFSNMRTAAAGILDIPLWKFEQQGASAITDTAFRLNHGKVLKSPRSRGIVALHGSSCIPLALQSSNTQGECNSRFNHSTPQLHLTLCVGRRELDWSCSNRRTRRHT